MAADENLMNSTRSTDFITPKSNVSRLFRNAVLELSEHVPFARPLVNSGRLSVPTIYDGCRLSGQDQANMPRITRPGAPAIDAPLQDGWLLDHLGNKFQLVVINVSAPDEIEVDGLTLTSVKLPKTAEILDRYLGSAASAVYLMRPDQHIMARWPEFDLEAIRAHVRNVLQFGKEEVRV